MFGRKKTNPENLPATTEPEDPSAAAHVLSRIIETGSRLQAPAIRAYVERVRAKSPDATPAEIVARLEKHYLAAVMGSGAAVGSAALVPGVGTVLALSLVAGETALFLETTAVFVLAVAEVHGVSADDKERRRTLVLGALAGDDGKNAVARLLGPGRTNGAWLAEGAATMPLPALSQVNTKLMKYFVKKYAIKRGALVFGKALPVGIGAVIGGVGNRLMGKRIVENARAAFGPAPTTWPGALRMLPPLEVDSGPAPGAISS
ncbi:hypothetical protein [[Mycobacterium] wendilense]|uniref:Di-and tripeptidase n=1 Tax=[Mycobacterium] wendilense TaxID=3064284 RepID=A0ABM9MB03_9MYCO|nr:hypothetical protein [Mycolicibacterium sp. MU0050]CAJ1580769.1 hypothetical protein MU0050_001208 [Mycolicibacterium sp. MU0050]